MNTPNLVNGISGRRPEKQSFLKDKGTLSQGGNSFLLPSLKKQAINIFNKAIGQVYNMFTYSIA